MRDIYRLECPPWPTTAYLLCLQPQRAPVGRLLLWNMLRSNQQERLLFSMSAMFAMLGCCSMAQRLSPVWLMAHGACHHLHVKVLYSVFVWGLKILFMIRNPTIFFLNFYNNYNPCCCQSEVRGCDSPKKVPHGRVRDYNLGSGRVLEFDCDRGYSLVGDALVRCMGGTTWSSTFPICQGEK